MQVHMQDPKRYKSTKNKINEKWITLLEDNGGQMRCKFTNVLKLPCCVYTKKKYYLEYFYGVLEVSAFHTNVNLNSLVVISEKKYMKESINKHDG